MQATQSRTVAGTWCRTEQFAALRYIDRHSKLESGAAVDGDDLPNSAGARDSDWPEFAPEAALLFQSIRECSAKLAVDGISLSEDQVYSAELRSLRDRGWALIGRFLRRPGALNSKQHGAETLAFDRLKTLEEGVSGWNAC